MERTVWAPSLTPPRVVELHALGQARPHPQFCVAPPVPFSVWEPSLPCPAPGRD